MKFTIKVLVQMPDGEIRTLPAAQGSEAIAGDSSKEGQKEKDCFDKVVLYAHYK